MDTKKVINQLLIERNMKIADIAADLDMKPQSMRQKLTRGTFSVNDFEKMLDCLNCRLQVVTNDTGKIFD